MKKNFTFLSIIFLAMMSIMMTSCDGIFLGCLNGNGYVVEEERMLADFTGIISEGSYDVFIIIDTVSKVVIEADENLIPYIRTVVHNDRLVIDNGTNRCLRMKNDLPIKVFVHTPEVFYINLQGAGMIYCDDLIYVDYLKIDLTGSGIIDLRDIDALELDVFLSGSGEIELWGVSGSGDLNIPGSGNIKAFDLEQDECFASISGSGNMYIFVHDYLEAVISGSGEIFYMGDPTIDVKITGSGSLVNNNK